METGANGHVLRLNRRITCIPFSWLLSKRAAANTMTMTNETASDDTSKPQLQRRQYLEHHLKASPTDKDAYLELAKIYRTENRPADARRVLEQGYNVFPEDAELLWEFEEATLARSLQQFREVSELATKLQTAETDRAVERSKLDWAARRIEICTARLSRDSTLTHLAVVIAEAHYELEAYDDALTAIEPALETDEHSCKAQLLRGRCLLQLSRDAEAMAALRSAALRRAVPSPAPVKIAALRLLCENAERLGVTLSLNRYREVLKQTEQEATS